MFFGSFRFRPPPFNDLSLDTLRNSAFLRNLRGDSSFDARPVPRLPLKGVKIKYQLTVTEYSSAGEDIAIKQLVLVAICLLGQVRKG